MIVALLNGKPFQVDLQYLGTIKISSRRDRIVHIPFPFDKNSSLCNKIEYEYL